MKRKPSTKLFLNRGINQLGAAVDALGPYDGDWHRPLLRAALLALESARSKATREILEKLVLQLNRSDECEHRLTRTVMLPARLNAAEVAQAIADELPCDAVEARLLNDEVVFTATLRGTADDAESLFDACLDRALARAKRTVSCHLRTERLR